MRRKLKKAKNSLLFIPPAIIFLDQLTKVFVTNKNLVTTCNRGFAFGLGTGPLNIFLVILVVLVCGYNYRDEKDKIRRFGYLLIIGGGTSNLIDRTIRGCVVDFIDFKVWPSFNLADAAITVGVAILVVSLILTGRRRDAK